MKRILPKSIDLLTENLSRLPGIGPKTASRLAFVMLTRSDVFLHNLGQAILGLKANLHPCPECFLITDETDSCAICQDQSRDQSILCVVEEPLDVVAIEHSGSFKGYYHVLGGVISPIDGIGPDQLNVQQLFKRLKSNAKIKEVILATNPSLEGEATALYLSEHMKDLSAKITRIARGLPSGGDLEYADEVTLQRALEGRVTIGNKED